MKKRNLELRCMVFLISRYIDLSPHFKSIVQKVCVYAQLLSHVQLFGDTWIVTLKVCISIGFHRQKYWNGLPFPSPGDLPHPGIEPSSPAYPALAGRFFTIEPPRKPMESYVIHFKFKNGLGRNGYL